ncbi:RagB/SusD family nutrient uptake outer membrane protein [Flavobacterium sp. ZT3R18]|uniref:RagB/SusD family nutrient uptake outer membrane protein n=1 Tax=Flavobacterium sp. ZT3R18 TaxID=2594429 RepID=UPI00117B54E1|nr:RagB/SusD family nutrient uptake outer membrane protein [Flavobacterium sp. ZT3R18]TRX32990.1 RagB/SusD family nutrient uptake outer membrane protein [Flavobacterium sp. ZT3R18]
MITISTQNSYTSRRFVMSLFLILTMGIHSCDSFVEVDLPKAQLTNVTVFEDVATANAALLDIYAKIRDKGLLTGTPYGLSNQLGNYADEIISYGAPADPTLDFYTNSLLPSNTAVLDFWSTTYNQIYEANAVIEGVQASTALTPEDKNRLKGEAFFIRALLHFYLTNLFGDIPYITTTDYKTNSSVSRMPTDEVYEHIIADLEASTNLLSAEYPNSDRIRPNKYVPKALLARVFLYKGKWAEAANAASAVLNNTSLYVFGNDIDTVFLKESKETIWQLMPATAGKNTDEANTFIFFSGPPPLVALSEDLVNSFDSNDLRKTHWIGEVTDGTNTWHHPYKYKEFNFTASSVEYSIVLRLAEQYLIRAEARAQQGDLIGAKEDLNKTRQRAGLGETAAVTQQQIISAIGQERRWELFTEYGHRFFDLKRSGTINNTLTGVKLGWDSTDVLFPLPQSELSVNPNLRPQNPGY